MCTFGNHEKCLYRTKQNCIEILLTTKISICTLIKQAIYFESTEQQFTVFLILDSVAQNLMFTKVIDYVIYDVEGSPEHQKQVLKIPISKCLFYIS